MAAEKKYCFVPRITNMKTFKIVLFPSSLTTLHKNNIFIFLAMKNETQ